MKNLAVMLLGIALLVGATLLFPGNHALAIVMGLVGLSMSLPAIFLLLLDGAFLMTGPIGEEIDVHGPGH